MQLSPNMAAHLSAEEKAVYFALQRAKLEGRPTPSHAELAAACGERATGRIPALLESLKVKAKLNRAEYLADPNAQRVLPFAIVRRQNIRTHETWRKDRAS